MPVHALHHFNFRAPAAELRALRDFYCDVVGLLEGARPAFRVPGYWLYAGDAPILHLSQMPAGQSLPEVPQRQAALDHVALRCSGLDAMLERLRAHGVDYSVSQVPATGDTQVFFTDPSGMGVELNFGAPP